jgi:mono/diheme cytochrome c family protein
VVCLVALAGCRQNMHNQPKYIPLRESETFADGTSARPLPAHTVARGFLRADSGAFTGLARDGRPVTDFPLAVSREILVRGEQRYNIFCSPCHDRAGTGRGMVVRRGYKQPPSFHIDRLRSSPVGYLYNVITEGFGVMPPYASQIPPEDRWAIVAYVRALQLSQNARLADLSPEERQKLDAAFKLPPVRPEDEGPRDGIQAPEPVKRQSPGRSENARERQ